MTIQGNTIIFNHNTKAISKILFWIGLFFVLVPFVVSFIVGICIYSSWKENVLHTLEYTGILFSATICLWVVAFIQKRKQNKGLFISISPQGVTDSKGNLIPISDIDHCHLEYHKLVMSNMTASPTDVGFPEYLVVLLKSGKTRKIKIRSYEAPSHQESLCFHDTANRILNIPYLFTERELVSERVIP